MQYDKNYKSTYLSGTERNELQFVTIALEDKMCSLKWTSLRDSHVGAHVSLDRFQTLKMLNIDNDNNPVQDL